MKEIVKDVISEYFDRVDEDDEILNKIIADKALDEELNSEEISRIIQMSNVKIFEKLFDATKDKTLEFDLAKPEKVKEHLKGKRPSVSFNDTHYEVPDQLEKEEETKELDIDKEELVKKLDELQRKKVQLELQVGEKKPKIKRKIKKKIQNYDPNSVIFAIKTSSPNVIPILKEVCKEEKILDKEAKEHTEALLKTSSDFLSDIESYGRMKAELMETSEKLEKVSYIIEKTGGLLSGGMKLLKGVRKAKRLKKTKDNISKGIEQGGDKSKKPFPSGKQEQAKEVRT